MEKITETLTSLTPTNWIAISAIFVAVALWLLTQHVTARRERKKSYSSPPVVKATINRKSYAGGWRSVQLHVVPVPDQQNFKYDNWLIEYVILLRPREALMARAKDDDYANGVFNPQNVVRSLRGKAVGRPQRFALEFFIKFSGNDRGRKAQFKVTYSPTAKRPRYSTTVWATVPDNAD